MTRTQTNPNYDYICYSDNPDACQNKGWDIIPIERVPDVDPCRQAKYYKVLPHKFLQKYEISIWVDGNKRVISKLNNYVNLLNNSNIVITQHDPRDRKHGVYFEGEHCIRTNKDNPELINKQLEYYRSINYKCDGKLIFARKHNEPDVIQFMEDWWTDITNYSKRDQISLPVAFHKNKKNLKYKIVPIRETRRWFKYLDHTNQNNWQDYK